MPFRALSAFRGILEAIVLLGGLVVLMPFRALSAFRGDEAGRWLIEIQDRLNALPSIVCFQRDAENAMREMRAGEVLMPFRALSAFRENLGVLTKIACF